MSDPTRLSDLRDAVALIRPDDCYTEIGYVRADMILALPELQRLLRLDALLPEVIELLGAARPIDPVEGCRCGECELRRAVHAVLALLREVAP